VSLGGDQRASAATIGGDPRQSSQTTPGDLSQRGSAAAAGPLVALSLYATRSVDSVRAAAPLPQYLAAVYGGRLVLAGAAMPDLGGQSPEAVVDELALTHPEWEPDALYAALTSP
jgi:hypothetical protein